MPDFRLEETCLLVTAGIMTVPEARVGLGIDAPPAPPEPAPVEPPHADAPSIDVPSPSPQTLDPSAPVEAATDGTAGSPPPAVPSDPTPVASDPVVTPLPNEATPNVSA